MNKPTLVQSIAVIGSVVILTGGSLLVAGSASGEDTATPSKPVPTEPKPRGHGGFVAGGVLGWDAEALSKQVGGLPQALRSDLAEILTTEDEAARTKLIEAVKKKAESGGYGEALRKQIEQAQKFRQGLGRKALGKKGDSKDRVKSSWADLPQAFKDDVAALKKLDRAERRDAWRKIAEDARAGKYGDDVKKKFEAAGRSGGHRLGGKDRDEKVTPAS